MVGCFITFMSCSMSNPGQSYPDSGPIWHGDLIRLACFAGVISRRTLSALEGHYQADHVLFLEDNTCRTCQLVKPAVRRPNHAVVLHCADFCCPA
jgi:hypothetical protein